MTTRSIVIQDDPRARRRRRIRLSLAALGLFLAGALLGGYGNLYLGLESAWENRGLREQIVAQRNAVEIHRYHLDKMAVDARRDPDQHVP